MESVFGSENYALAKTLLDATELRHRALASNLANAETPGYKRVDLSKDFAAQLDSALRSGGGARAIGQVAASLERDSEAKAVRPDGNNVAMESEMLQLNRNAMEYEFLTRYVSSNLSGLKRAITGRASP
jgi:flagellar basal-body rod protein FlgB